MMKAMFISTAIVSSAVMLKLSLPVTLEFLTDIFSNLTISYFQPPYLYILINCIILSIVASSKLHSAAPPPPSSLPAVDFVAAVVEVEEVVEEVKEVVFGYTARRDKDIDCLVVEDREGEFEILKSGSTLDEKVVPKLVEEVESVKVVEERLPYSARFGHRKAVKATPEGKTVLKKVSRPKRQETLESTWRTLTEGRSIPLTRHLRKSDTFTGAQQEASSPVHSIKKSDTFSYGSIAESPSPGSSSGGKLRREPSLSQDDLNRRVEAFIKKFNEQMRLQRQESINLRF